MKTRVCFVTDFLTAEMVRNLLEQNGLHPLPLSLTVTAKAMQGARGYDIETPDHEAAQAKKLLSEHHRARQFLISE